MGASAVLREFSEFFRVARSLQPARLHVRVALALLGASTAAGTLGCRGDTVGTAPVATAAKFFSMTLNEHAINLSLSDPASNTIQLTATAVDADGHPTTQVGQTTFIAVDSAVTVSQTGLVTAKQVTTSAGSQVIAKLQIGNGTRTDTAWIRVTQDPPSVPLASFSIQPAEGDSAVGAVGDQYVPPVQAKDQSGQLLPFDIRAGMNDIYWIHSSNPIVANVSSLPWFAFTDTGHVTLYAESWVYGVPVRDSLQFLVNWPMLQQLLDVGTPGAVAAQFPIYLGVGGVVNWVYFARAKDSVDFVFDDSTAVDSAQDAIFGAYSGSGSISFVPGRLQVKARRFPTAGTYHFHDRLHPSTTSMIFVLSNPRR